MISWLGKTNIADTTTGDTGGPAASMKPGQKSCVIKLISAYTLSARSLVKDPLKGNEAAGLHIVGAKPSEAPTEKKQSQWLDHIGVPNVARQC